MMRSTGSLVQSKNWAILPGTAAWLSGSLAHFIIVPAGARGATFVGIRHLDRAEENG